MSCDCDDIAVTYSSDGFVVTMVACNVQIPLTTRTVSASSASGDLVAKTTDDVIEISGIGGDVTFTVPVALQRRVNIRRPSDDFSSGFAFVKDDSGNTLATLKRARDAGMFSGDGSLTHSLYSGQLNQPYEIDWASGGTLTLDYNLADDFFVNLNGDVDTLAVANIPVGRTMRAGFLQDAVGGHVISIPGGWVVGSPAPAIDATGYALSVITVTNLGSGVFVVAGAQAYKPDWEVAKLLAIGNRNRANVVNAMDFIPRSLHADILAGVSMVDLSAYLNDMSYAAGEYGTCLLPGRPVCGTLIEIYFGQTWLGGTLQQPSGSGDHIIIDNYWNDNVTLPSDYQCLFRTHLIGAQATRSKSPGRVPFIGHLAGNTLTVDSVFGSAPITAGQSLRLPGIIADGVTVGAQIGGTTGGAGTYNTIGPSQTVADQWILASDFNTTGGAGYLCYSSNVRLDGVIFEGLVTGISPTGITENGTPSSNTTQTELYIEGKFVNCEAALDAPGNTTIKKCNFRSVSFTNCGLNNKPVIHATNGFQSWSIESFRFSACHGPLILSLASSGGCRIVDGTIELNGSGYMDATSASPATEFDFISLKLDSAGLRETELIDLHFVCNMTAPQHIYRPILVTVATSPYPNIVHRASYDSDLAPNALNGFNLECFHADKPTLLTGRSEATYRSDFTRIQQGNAQIALGGPATKLPALGASAAWAQPQTDAYFGQARANGGFPVGWTRFKAFDDLLNTIGQRILGYAGLFYILAAPDEATALTNIAIPKGPSLLPVGTLTFVPDRGITGDGASGYLDTGYLTSAVPGTALGSQTVIVWTGDDTEALASPALGTSMGSNTSINPRGTVGNMLAQSQSGNNHTVAVSAGKGSFGLLRSSTSGYEQFFNGSKVGTQTDTALSNNSGNFLLLGNNTANSPQYSARNLLAAWIGPALASDADMTTLMNAVSTFLTSIGALS